MMSRISVKKQISASYEACAADFASADLLENIKLSCANVVQETEMPEHYCQKKENTRTWMFKAVQFALACALIFIIAKVGVDHITKTPGPGPEPTNPTQVVAASSIIIDVNPSVELGLDINNVVVSVKALNFDAENVLASVELVGLDSKEALTKLVSVLFAKGYLQGETDTMLVSVETTVDTDLVRVEEDVKLAFANNSITCRVVVQGMNRELVEEAASKLNISDGKMEFIQRIITKSDEYFENDSKPLSEKTVKELVDIFDKLKGLGIIFDDVIGSAGETAGEAIGEIGDKVDDLIGGAGDVSGEIIKDAGETAGEIIDKTGETAGEIIDKAGETAGEIIDKAGETAGEIIDKTGETAGEIIDKAGEAASDIVSGVGETVSDIIKDIGDLLDKIGINPNDATDEGANTVEEITDEASKTVEKITDESSNIVEEVVGEAGEKVQEEIQKVEETISKVIDKSGESISDRIFKRFFSFYN